MYGSHGTSEKMALKLVKYASVLDEERKNDFQK